MEAVSFGSCSGWLHDAPASTGVVLCGAYGHEALWTHRPWRRLAEHLAACGLPTLRFDYPGTGDALGDEADGDRVEAWLDGIAEAVQWLRDRTGVERVVLCGVRLGALLAAVAINRIGNLDALVLLAPPLSGREFIRETRLVHRRWRNTSVPHLQLPDDPDDHCETLGFRLYRDSLAHLQRINLGQAPVPTVPHMLVLDPAPRPALQAWLARVQGGGAEITVAAFDDYVGMTSETGTNRIPQQTFEAISTWLCARFDARTPRDARPPRTAEAILHGDGFIERPIVFDDGRLFGIYCQPAHADRTPVGPTAQAVLFPNTAGNHHIGDARMWVVAARRLARQGIASLRMDVSTLGDSRDARETSPLKSLHDAVACDDAAKGIDWLFAQGHHRPVAAGVCSGAYLAMHGAARSKHAAGLVLINQHIYVWSDARHLPGAAPRLEPTRVYLESLRRPDKWLNMLRAPTRALSVSTRLLQRCATNWRLRCGLHLGEAERRAGGPGAARELIRDLHARGVSMCMLYGDFDAGLEECETLFGKRFRWLTRFPTIQAMTHRDLDHALFLYPARERMMQVLESYLVAASTSDRDRRQPVDNDGTTDTLAAYGSQAAAAARAALRGGAGAASAAGTLRV
ncbi:serine aminopeptidase domain-containing protein [Chitinasiproducens palmae]|uniref:Serine aminopeptidase, S33 n=1 Tax=Chitinasiproducens palmae TaxID=1770053 RepID=A0A1H2PTU0_9BURK|nr:alpha/beta hydrolase [Chitinasiproducens palmae]SDV50547.1 Serine aminopeptidase, S33 [Chitinasiproducens palmae]